MSAATIIPDRLRENPRNFFFLDINVDEDFDSNNFLDLVFSFRHNYTLRYVTLVRSTEDGEQTADKKPVVQRTHKELRLLVKEILRLPKLRMLDFENFGDDELQKFNDLLRSVKTVQ